MNRTLLPQLAQMASLLFLMSAATPSLAAQEPTPSVATASQEVTVLRLNGEAVSQRRFEDWLLLNYGELDAGIYARLLRLRWRATELGQGLDMPALESRVLSEVEARLAGPHAGDRAAWEQELAQEGRTPAGRMAERRITLELQLLEELFAREGTPVSPEQVRDLWEQRYGQGGFSPRVRLLRKRFVVPFAPGENTSSRRVRTEKLRAEMRSEMEALLARARGGEGFAKMAREESDHPSGENGGLPAKDEWRGAFPRAPLSALAKQPVGSLSQPIFARGAFWILRLEGLVEVPFTSVRDELTAELTARTSSDRTSRRQLLAELADAAPLRLATGLLDPSDTTAETELFGVGDEVVRRDPYATWLRHLHGEQAAQRFALEAQLWRRARLAKIQLTPADLEEGTQRARDTDIELSFHGKQEAWLASLAARELSPEAWRRAAQRRVELELLEDSLSRVGRTVSEAELRLLWEQRFGPGGKLVLVRWIQGNIPMSTADLNPAEREVEQKRLRQETVARLTVLRQQILAGADFATLASEHSDDAATASRGGSPEDGFAIDELPAELLVQLDSLDPGGISPATPLASDRAVVLLQLVSVDITSFADARESLESEALRAPANMGERALLRAELSRSLDLVVDTTAMLR
ncbi:MAG: parvulin-like peptidyl-prolyl isomerase [Planctomycetota bacterium]|jgi:parvulin-like peptidyl-prolyl isomerase